MNFMHRSRGALAQFLGASLLTGLMSVPAIKPAQAAPVPAPGGGTAPTSRPNIVVIMADDMGYSDLGCYGSEINTPNLDKLAQGGVRFTQFYNTARCCPTRASLLTGLYPHEAGVGHMTEERVGADGNVLPGYEGHLNNQCVTIAEALHGAGYFTAMTGKWHVGQNFGVVPWNRGFDRSLNSPGGGFYFPDGPKASLFYNGQNVHQRDAPLPKQWYSSDLWTDFGLRFVDEAKQAKKPFFLYVAENAPHFPLQAPAADIARWRGKYKAGWDKLRQARYERQIKMGLVDKKWPLSPRLPVVPAWDTLTPAQKDRYDNIMAIYAAVVEHMDSSIGRLIDGLKQRGELDNTLILFLSDNGGNAESGVPGRLEGASPGNAASTVFVGQCWATLNNTPLVRYKHFTDEGGISAPLIAHWPQGIAKARDGKFETQPGHVIDIMATCVDVGHAKYPTLFGGHTIQPMEGVSLRPAFAGQNVGRKQPLFWEHEENRAVRDGQWKLVALRDAPWRLYDMSADRSEQHDLASAQPQRVKAMSAQWDVYAARTHVLPLGGWRAPTANGKGKGKGNGNQGGAASTKTHFDLKMGDTLNVAQSPAVGGHGFTITAKFDTKSPSGVLVAQGGLARGYVLFLNEGKLTFLVHRQQTRTQVATAQPITGAHTAVARLAGDGTMTLSLDGQPAITEKSDGIIKAMPLDGLSVGADTGAPVGPYTGTNPFSGTINSLSIDLDQPDNPAPPTTEPED
ncbi:arylsulfatase [Abditibacteriota bacterium]|nr:arylsulfatase [Abditibacteriota bacterium]